MGQILFPIFKTPVANRKTETTGEFLASELEVLEEIAMEYDLVPLSEFGDPREVPPDFEGPPSELEELLGPCDEWYPPAEGKTAILALVELIRENVGVAARFRAPDKVAEELIDLARLMDIAHEHGTSFRLDLR